MTVKRQLIGLCGVCISTSYHAAALIARSTRSRSLQMIRQHNNSNNSNNYNNKNSNMEEKQRETLIQRGSYEAQLMSALQTPIPSCIPSSEVLDEGGFFASILREDGVVRMDDVLPDDLADAVRASVLELHQTAQHDLNQNNVSYEERFAKCLLSTNRCDLLLPLEGLYQTAMQSLLSSVVGSTLEHTLGSDATLYEFASLISYPGSHRQNVHPDHPCLKIPDLDATEPLCLTCFVALQDIDESMGPTIWIPNTHHDKAHDRFQRIRVEDMMDEYTPKDELLRSSVSYLGLLPKGSAVIFDSRLLHCGGSNNNNNNTPRALFYCTFKHPKVGFPGNTGSLGYGLDDTTTLASLRHN